MSKLMLGAGLLVSLFVTLVYASMAASTKTIVLGKFGSEECLASPSWFPNTPKPVYPTPDLKVDCDFYAPAWQTLLYLTQPDHNGKARFLNFPGPDDIFGKTATLRFPLTANGAPIPRGELRLAPRLGLSTQTFTPSEIVQAGSNGLLIDKNHHAIYYAVVFNDIYVNFIDNNIHIKNNILALSKVDPTKQFPSGSVEIKSSWQIALPNEDLTNYFHTKALLSKLKTDMNNKIVIDPDHSFEAEVKLMGIHVVFVMEGHPEFVWATFEHEDNAPDLAFHGDPNGPDAVDNTRDWTFYQKGVPTNHCNHKPGQGPSPAPKLDDAAQTLTPTVSIFRQYTQGGETEARPNAIDQINISVHALAAKWPQLSVWQHYNLVGATWLNQPQKFQEGHNFETDDVLQPKSDHDANPILGGDIQLSNSTIESFTQNTDIPGLGDKPQPDFRREACFSCHATQGVSAGGQTLPPLRVLVSQSLSTAWKNAVQSSGH